MTSRCFVAIALFACAQLGCEHDMSAIVRTKHANDYRCDESSIKVAHLRHDRWKAIGCGTEANYYCYIDRDSGQDRCARPDRTLMLRHAKQFGCSPNEVRARHLGGGESWEVDGCGQKASYSCKYEGQDEFHCVMDSSSASGEHPPR